MEINPLPKLPEEKINEAVGEKRLVVFLGAGLSCAAGLPTWGKIKERLIGECTLNESTADGLKDEWRRSQAGYYEVFEQIRRKDPNSYSKIIKESIDIKQANIAEYSKLLKIIQSWKPTSIVTTNIDELLLNAGIFKEEHLIKSPESFYPQDLRNGNVFFLHGIGDQGLWSFDDKKNFYNMDGFKIFLWNIFGSYCVIFIGCSLNDRDLWMSFLKINRNDRGDSFHYALVPSSENVRPTQLKDFYGIESLVYDNSNGYGNFISSLERWNMSKPLITADNIEESGSRPSL